LPVVFLHPYRSSSCSSTALVAILSPLNIFSALGVRILGTLPSEGNPAFDEAKHELVGKNIVCCTFCLSGRKSRDEPRRVSHWGADCDVRMCVVDARVLNLHVSLNLNDMASARFLLFDLWSFLTKRKCRLPSPVQDHSETGLTGTSHSLVPYVSIRFLALYTAIWIHKTRLHFCSFRFDSFTICGQIKRTSNIMFRRAACRDSRAACGPRN
jgi:hypothetical protein